MRIRSMLVALGVVGLLSVVLVTPARAEVTTIVWQANLTIPVMHKKAALGTLTTVVDSVSGQGTWAFQGTIDGQLASASGAGTLTVDDGALTVSMTRIDAWRMPGLRQPALPATATIRLFGSLAYVSYGRFLGIPIAVSPSLSLPLRSGTYTLMMPGSGTQPVPVLPNTGFAAGAPLVSAEPVRLSWLAGLYVLSPIVPIVVVLTFARRRRWCRASAA